ncbi:Transposon Tf2-12 polyprotein [Vitis vinifera]|uniref:Transposon Tf2-12 polyprotein n=1 Tax=Vitis vinifera TaxID=29760 RepID=A0A438CSZ7_VITVI|nr:Transposon Tf2-12 polyprotein [Vitis vinifera]
MYGYTYSVNELNKTLAEKTNVEFRNDDNEILARHDTSFDQVNAVLQEVLTELQALRASHNQNTSPRDDSSHPTYFSWLTKFCGPLTWDEFTKAVQLRFGPTDYKDPSEALTRLKQTTSVAAYQEAFERLSYQVDGLPESFLIGCFIAGLRDEIRIDRKPNQQTRFQPASLTPKASLNPTTGVLGPPPNQRMNQSSNAQPATFLRITNQEARERREKGLCYYCDEKFVAGHRCERPQLFMIEDVPHMNTEDVEGAHPKQEHHEVIPEISFHAIAGTEHPINHTRSGQAEKQELIRDKKFEVMVANREKIECTGQCRGLTLTIQGYSVIADYYILPVTTCQLVLGVQWLETLGPIEMDYKQLTMNFKVEGTPQTFQGLRRTSIEALSDKESNGLQGTGLFFQIIPSTTTNSQPKSYPPEIGQLLAKFSHVFESPTSLPLGRSHDHQIPLQSSAGPVEYLGHIISEQGVSVDPAKIQAIIEWPTPTTPKRVCGFLGSRVAFTQLKEALTLPPILRLLNFTQRFVIECDASGIGLGAILTQENRPVAYYSQALKGSALSLSTYEIEMLAIVKAIKLWRPYLLGKPFTVRTNQKSLKYLLEQRITTPAQTRWLPKLLGYDYEIEIFLQQCDICQRFKTDCMKPAGLLQPLPVPTQMWTDVSMDFIEGLPSSNGYTSIMVVVDRLTKYAHFVTLKHPFTAVIIAKAFVANVVRLHGIPTSIVSDQDKVVYQLLLASIVPTIGNQVVYELKLPSPIRRPNEVVNRTLEQYLQCFAGDQPRKWLEWIPWAEFSYNTSTHFSTKMTPFEAVYGIPHPRLLAYVPGTFHVQAVDEYLRDRDAILLGPVAYKLALPLGSQIHDVFHVSLLKKHLGPVTATSTQLPPVSDTSTVLPQPEAVLDRRVIHKGKYRPKSEILVKWVGVPAEDATWENEWRFTKSYPDFILVDKDP